MTCRKKAVERHAFSLAAFVLAVGIAFVWRISATACLAEDPIVAADNISTIDKEADKCLRPADAIALYTGFLAQADLPPGVRLNAEKKLELWKDRERKGLCKAGKDWVTPEELAKRSTALLKAGLTFRKLGNKKFARNELLKASALDLNSGTSEMWLGLFDVFDREYLSAMRHFQEAARREPTNAGAYSNAALSGFRAGRTTRVAEDFRCAIECAGMGEGVSIAENMSLVLALHSGEGLDIAFQSIKSMPTGHLEALKKLYGAWLSDHNVDLHNIDGFTWFEPDLPPGFERPDLVGDKEVGKAIPPSKGGGTGFVVAPQFVITNAHVVKGADKITVIDPSTLKKTTAEPSAAPSDDGSGDEIGLAAEVLFLDSKVDLALLKCTELAMPPLRMRLKVPRRGTELLSLGFPLLFDIGTSIKATGGKVVSEPESDPAGELKSIFYHDALINGGNSGGPLVDDTAAVIGVNVAKWRKSGAQYDSMFMGVPVEEVWRLLKASGHDVPASEASSTASMKWPDVDEIASKSTVVILAETKGKVRE